MKEKNDRGVFKWLLIGFCALFLLVMLILPLLYVVITSLRDGWNAFWVAVSAVSYTHLTLPTT